MDRLCVVIQGPTTNVGAIRQAFNEAGIPIVFSTWDSDRQHYTESDTVIFHEQPDLKGSGNINLQKLTTLGGLYKAKNLGYKHVIKFRSDMIPTNPKKFIESLCDNKLNFFSWHYVPDTEVGGYMVDYFMAGPIDDIIKIWSFDLLTYSIPEAIITNNIVKYFNASEMNFLVNTLNDDNDINWMKYGINLKTYKNIKTNSWFDEINLRDSQDVINRYKTIFG